MLAETGRIKLSAENVLLKLKSGIGYLFCASQATVVTASEPSVSATL